MSFTKKNSSATYNIPCFIVINSLNRHAARLYVSTFSFRLQLSLISSSKSTKKRIVVQYTLRGNGKGKRAQVWITGWLRGTVVERRSLTGELSLSCARPAADG